MNMMQRFNRVLGERMASSGRMAMIESVGRTSGRRFRTPVGYVRNDDGTVWVGAGRLESHWPRNLLVNPGCHLRAGSTDGAFIATELHGEERAAAVAAIHAKYGAPAARVGTGPVFVLRPATKDDEVDATGEAGTTDEAGTTGESEAAAA